MENNIIRFNSYKLERGGLLYDMYDQFNARVGDQGTPLVMQWTQGLADTLIDLQAKKLHFYAAGQVGQYLEKLKDGTGYQMSADASQVEYEDRNAAGTMDHGITKVKLPKQFFPQEGIFYGYFGLKDDQGNTYTSVNVWFRVLGGVPIMGAAIPYFSTRFDELMETFKGRAADALAELRQEYLDEVKKNQDMSAQTRTALEKLAASVGAIKAQIDAGNVITRKEFNQFGNKMSTALSNMRPKPEAFDNLDALKQKYPNGNDRINVTTDNQHYYIYQNGAWKDCGVYQSAGIADRSIDADKLASSVITGEDLMKTINMADALNKKTVGYGYSADSNNTFRSDQKGGQIHYTINQLDGSKAYTTWNFGENTILSTENLALRFRYKATMRLTIEYSLIKSDGTVDAKTLSLQNDVSNNECVAMEVISMDGYKGLQFGSIRGTFGSAAGTAELYNFEIFLASDLQKKYSNLQDAIAQLTSAVSLDSLGRIDHTLVGYGYSADDGNSTNTKLVNNRYHYILNQRKGSTAYATWGFDSSLELVDPVVVSFKYIGTLKFTIEYALIRADGSQVEKSLAVDSATDSEVHTYKLYVDNGDYEKFKLKNIRGTFGAAEGYLELFDFKSVTSAEDKKERSVAKIVTDQQSSYLMLNFDDATNMYKKRYELLKSYGFRFSFCLNEGFYNNKGFLDGEREQFNQMLADGNDVALYGGVGTRPDIQTCTSNQWADYVKPLVDFANENGIYNITCYHSPDNTMTANGAQGLQQLGFKMARYATSPDKSLVEDFDQNSFLIPTLEIKDDNLTDVTSQIDKAIKEGASLSIFTHLVQDNITSVWNTSTQVYTQLLDYIKQKVNNDRLRVVTWREFYVAKLPQEGHENDYLRIMKTLYAKSK